MFKSIALLACAIVVVVADPGYLGDAYALGHGYGYGGHGYSSYGQTVIPTAVSHQSNVAIHSKPIVNVIKPHLVAAIPAATSHQSRVDIHSKPIVYTKAIVSYAAPHLFYGSSYVATASPIVSGLYGSGYHGLEGHGLGYGYGHGLSYGHDYYGSHY